MLQMPLLINLLVTSSPNRNIPDTGINIIMDNLLHVLPVLHKKVIRMDLCGVKGNLTPPQLVIIGMLSRGSLTMTQLADKLAVKKPQMTLLVEQLVSMGVIERHPDPIDRRVIHLVLSKRGGELLAELKEKVKENIRTKLGALTPDEIDQMSSALQTLRGIVTKL